jgi:hypothetical protein
MSSINSTDSRLYANSSDVLYISADSIADVKLLIVLGGQIKQAISHFHDVICPERLKAV